MKNYTVRLAWTVIIPLFLLSIIGISTSFAETGVLQLNQYHYGHIISYNTTSGITIYDAEYYNPASSLVVSVSSTRDGEIIFDIFKELLLDSYKCEFGDSDPDAFVLVNGNEVPLTHIDNPNEKLVSIKINIQAGLSNIEILRSADMGLWAFDYGCPRELSEYVLLLPPSQQIQNSVLAKDIICKEELELILKFTDNSPACVRSETAKKLIERGWSETFSHPQNTVWIDQIYYQCGGPIWVQDWTETHDKPWNYSPFGKIESGEVDIIYDYFKTYDITIIDVKRSNANAQACEACSCADGTYYLLMSLEDHQKWLNLKYIENNKEK